MIALKKKRISENFIEKLYPSEIFASHFGIKLKTHKTIETRAVYIHKLNTISGKEISVVQKTTLNNPIASGTSPELYFYEEILPQWKSIQNHTPVFLGKKKNIITNDIYLSYIDAKKMYVTKNFERILNFIFSIQQTSHDVIPTTLPEPSFFNKKTRGRFKNHKYYVNALFKNIHSSKFLPNNNKKNNLIKNLDRLRDLCMLMPTSPCHLDLLSKNILVDGEVIKFIDWGEFCFAPPGFEAGGLLSSIFRKGSEKYCIYWYRRFWQHLDAQSPDIFYGDKADYILSASYFFCISILRYLLISVERDNYEGNARRVEIVFSIFNHAISPLLEKNASLENPLDFRIK